MDQENKKPTVAGKTSALRFTGDKPIILQNVDAASLGSGFTLEAWVRPSAVERGVVLNPQERLGGSGVSFGPGRYDDLAHFRIADQGLKSLRVPANYRAVLFSDTGCSGLSLVAENDVIALGEKWDQSARSLLVIDLHGAAHSYAVVFEEEGFQGRTAVLNFRRYETLTFLAPGQSSFSSIYVPPGLDVTLYDHANCRGTSFTVQNEVTDIQERFAQTDDWDGEIRSLALTRAADGSAPRPSVEARQAAIMTAGSGDGLALEIAPSSSPVRPLEIQFARTRLRADRWHHIAQTYDGAHLVSYVNGRAVHTRKLEDAPDLAGPWHMGDGFYGEIGLISLRAGARSPQTLRARRFDFPPTEGFDKPDPDDGTTLRRAWLFESKVEDDASLIELITAATADIPAGEVFWVAAQLPRSSLMSSIGRKALSRAQLRSNNAQQQAHLDGLVKLDKARKRAQQKVRDGNIRAQSQAHAARIEHIHTILGGDVMQLGPNGRELGKLQDSSIVWIDIAADAATGIVYLAGGSTAYAGYYSVNRVRNNGGAEAPEDIAWRKKPVHALCVNSEQKLLYWIEGDGDLMRSQTKAGQEPVKLPSALFPGRAGEWSLAFDPSRQRLLWSNGREIWTGKPTGDNPMQEWHVIVSHGRSPYPVALTVDEESGDIYWLDKELEMVRTCNADGDNIRDLYEALDPRAAIALDYFDLSKLTTVASDHPALARKRLYWNAEYRKVVEAAVIDDPGLFNWLQPIEEPPKVQNHIAALEDTRFNGVRWTEWLDEPKTLFAIKQHVYQFVEGLDHPLRAITHVFYNDRMQYRIDLWDVMGGKFEDILSWRRLGTSRFKEGNPPPSLFAANRTATRFICNRILESGGISRAGAMIFEPRPSHNRILIEGYDNIKALAFSEDGRQVLLGLEDGSIAVWGATKQGDQQFVLSGTGSIQCIAPYAINGAQGDRQIALSGASDGTIRQWDLSTSDLLHTFIGHDQSVNAITVSSDRKYAVSASADNTLKVWDLTSGASLQTLKGHKKAVNDVAIHPDGHLVISASSDQTVKVWEIESGVCLHTFEGHAGAVLRVALTGDSQQIVAVGEQKTVRWDLIRQPWMMQFDGEQDYVDLGPLFLDCEQGFSAEIQLRLAQTSIVTEFFNLGNGRDGDNISLTLYEEGSLVFGINQHGVTREIATEANALSVDVWHTISVVVDAAGAAVIHIDGAEAATGQVPLPRACLRLQNEIGRSPLDQTAFLSGEIRALRLWNQALTIDEIERFHKQPLAMPAPAQPDYHRSMMEYRNGRPYLMSGMSDGSTPADALFKMASDKGLALQSKSTNAHAKLLIAHFKKEVADRNAAAKRAQAAHIAQEKRRIARADNQAAHAQAQAMLDKANADAAKKRADNRQRLAVANQSAKQKIDMATADADQKRADADRQAQQIKDEGKRKAENITRSAHQKLSDAQAEKAKYE